MSIHIDRFTKYCHSYIKQGLKEIKACRDSGKPGWIAVARRMLELTEMLDALGKQSKGMQLAYFNETFSPATSGYLGALIQDSMNRVEDPFSLHFVVDDHEMNSFIVWTQKQIGKSVSEANQMVMVQHYQVAAFVRAGRHVYECSPSLAEKLRKTELRGLMCEHLRLPYPSIYVLVPPELGFKVFNDQTGWHDVEGVYINEDNYVPLVGEHVPLLDKEEAVRGWRIVIIGKSKNDNEIDDAIFYFSIRFPEGATVDQQLFEFKRSNDENPIATQMHEKGFDVEVFKWVMNVVLYTTSANVEMETYIHDREARMLAERIQKLPKISKKKERLKEQLRGMSTQTVKYLGRGISPFPPEQRHEGGKLIVYQQVEGHWRRVPHGPRSVPLLERPRKTMWIEPYWRGPEDGPISAPKHVLKESKETKGGKDNEQDGASMEHEGVLLP